jgi:hypothetical protein
VGVSWCRGVTARGVIHEGQPQFVVRWLLRRTQTQSLSTTPPLDRRTAGRSIAARWYDGEMFGSAEYECPLRLQLLPN